MKGQHLHECENPKCGFVWEHGADSFGNAVAHSCPVCGSSQWARMMTLSFCYEAFLYCVLGIELPEECRSPPQEKPKATEWTPEWEAKRRRWTIIRWLRIIDNVISYRFKTLSKVSETGRRLWNRYYDARRYNGRWEKYDTESPSMGMPQPGTETLDPNRFVLDECDFVCRWTKDCEEEE